MKKVILLFIALSVIFFYSAIIIAKFWFYFNRDLPNLDLVTKYKPNLVSKIYDNQGNLIAEFYEQRRYAFQINEVPDYVKKAFIAAEDESFYTHNGISVEGMLRAFFVNLKQKKISQGGSTITQQLVKNLLVGSEKKIERKIKEAILALKIEEKLSKEQILERYLNQIYLGNSAYGLLAASRLYFHKEINELTIAEASLLAGLPKAPSRYDPVKNLNLAKQRQVYVLNQMLKNSFITKKDYEQAKNEEMKIFAADNRKIYKAPYYVTEVIRNLDILEEYNLNSDGIEIHTYLDLELDKLIQTKLMQGLKSVYLREKGFNSSLPSKITSYNGIDLEAKVIEKEKDFIVVELDGEKVKINTKKKVRDRVIVSKTKDGYKLDQIPELQGACVILDPEGKVLAISGGYNYFYSEFNRATQMKRQPGSAFKPVVYLAAVDHGGYTPSTIVYDEPRSFLVGNEYWTPKNYDNKFLGPITLRTALEKSKNLISADIISKIGVDTVIRYARKLGIRSELGNNLSIALGSREVDLLEITNAYNVFNNQGVYSPPALIKEIKDYRGNTIYYDSNINNQVISKEVAFLMTNMLSGVIKHGTARSLAKLQIQAAGKTGTSNDNTDAWFIGYTPEISIGIWVGYDLKKSIGKKATGSSVAVPIWYKIVESLIDKEFLNPKKEFTVPENVEYMFIDKSTGLPKENGFKEYFIKGTYKIKKKFEKEKTINYWDSDIF